MEANRGWICPVCGKGVRPDLATCPCLGAAQPFVPQPYPHPPWYPGPYVPYAPPWQTWDTNPNITWEITTNADINGPFMFIEAPHFNLNEPISIFLGGGHASQV
jgi:hypothetical protein